MSEFKVGDKVFVNSNDVYDRDVPNWGKILNIPTDGTKMHLLEFEGWDQGHAGGPIDDEKRNRWWVHEKYLTPKEIYESPLFKAMRENDEA